MGKSNRIPKKQLAATIRERQVKQPKVSTPKAASAKPAPVVAADSTVVEAPALNFGEKLTAAVKFVATGLIDSLSAMASAAKGIAALWE